MSCLVVVLILGQMTSGCCKFFHNWYKQKEHLIAADSRHKGTPLWVVASSPWQLHNNFSMKCLYALTPEWFGTWFPPSLPMSSQPSRGQKKKISQCSPHTGVMPQVTPGCPSLSSLSGPDSKSSNQGQLGTIFKTTFLHYVLIFYYYFSVGF